MVLIPEGPGGSVTECDNPPCCNIDHLFLGTHADNMRDAAAKGRLSTPARIGQNHGRAVLTTADVLEIRTTTENRADVAARFSISCVDRQGHPPT